MNSFKIIMGSHLELDNCKNKLISFKKDSFGFKGLIETSKLKDLGDIKAEIPTLDDIMIFHSNMEVRK